MQTKPLRPIPPMLRFITAIVLLIVAVALFISQHALVLNHKGQRLFTHLKTAVTQRLPHTQHTLPALPITPYQETAC